MRAFRLLLIAVGLMQASQVVAQSDDILSAQAGRWLVAPTDGRPGCIVTLEMTNAIGGRTASAAANCAESLPPFANLAAWVLGASGLALIDPTRRPLARFTEDETALLHDKERNLMLVRPVSGVDRLPHASAIFGDWTMRRPGGPALCSVSFAQRPPAGGQESNALTLKPGCDPAVARLKLASWRVEGPNLMLYGNDGSSLGFVLTATGFTKRPEEGGRPLVIERAR
jgi:hypothetical protein